MQTELITRCMYCWKLYQQWQSTHYKAAYNAQRLLEVGKHPYDHAETTVRSDSEKDKDVGRVK